MKKRNPFFHTLPIKKLWNEENIRIEIEKEKDIYKNSNPFVYITIYFYEKKPRTRNCVFLYFFFYFFNWCLLYFVISAGTLCWWYWSNYIFFFIYFAWWRWKIIISLSNRRTKKGFLSDRFYFCFFNEWVLIHNGKMIWQVVLLLMIRCEIDTNIYFSKLWQFKMYKILQMLGFEPSIFVSFLFGYTYLLFEFTFFW